MPKINGSCNLGNTCTLWVTVRPSTFIGSSICPHALILVPLADRKVRLLFTKPFFLSTALNLSYTFSLIHVTQLPVSYKALVLESLNTHSVIGLLYVSFTAAIEIRLSYTCSIAVLNFRGSGHDIVAIVSSTSFPDQPRQAKLEHHRWYRSIGSLASASYNSLPCGP